MKFRFLGGLDCPEWILSQIPEIAKIDADGLREFCTSIMDKQKAKCMEWNESEIRRNIEEENGAEINADVLRKFKAKVAAVSFIFEKAAKNECSSRDLEKELLQLGLPSDQANVLSDVFESEQKILSSIFADLPIKAPAFGITRIEPVLSGSSESTEFLRVHLLNSAGTPSNLLFARNELEQLKKGIESGINQLEAIEEK